VLALGCSNMLVEICPVFIFPRLETRKESKRIAELDFETPDDLDSPVLKIKKHVPVKRNYSNQVNVGYGCRK
jgi:hypothetical protein